MIGRIGECPVGATSVIVAVSSAHRKESLEAVQYGIDCITKHTGAQINLMTRADIKARVPIWKKEFYEDGSMWKDNCEACHHTHHIKDI